MSHPAAMTSTMPSASANSPMPIVAHSAIGRDDSVSKLRIASATLESIRPAACHSSSLRSSAISAVIVGAGGTGKGGEPAPVRQPQGHVILTQVRIFHVLGHPDFRQEDGDRGWYAT